VNPYINFFPSVNYFTPLDRSLNYFAERGRMAVLRNVDLTKRKADLVGHLAEVGAS
jgi:hypothetical protein